MAEAAGGRRTGPAALPLLRLLTVGGCLLAGCRPAAAGPAVGPDPGPGSCWLSDDGLFNCSQPARSLVLQEGDIPESATSLLVAHVQEVTIATNATLSLPLLEHVTLRDLGRLVVESDGLRPPAGGALRSLDVARVAAVTLRRRALSGRWAAGGRLQVTDAAELVCGSRSVPLAAVTLANVTMEICAPSTFSGAGRLLLSGSRLGTVEPLCFRPRPGGALLLRASSVDFLLPMAVSGRLSVLNVTDSQLGTVGPGAVSGRLRRLQLQGHSVGRLTAEAVRATVQEVTLRRLRVERLSGRALAGLRRVARLQLVDVSLGDAKPSALLLDDSVSAGGLRLQSLYLTGLSCRCHMEEEARRLAGANGPRPPAATAALARLLMAHAFCATPQQPHVLARFSEMGCGAPSPPPPTGAAPTSQRGSTDQTVVFHVVLAGAATLALALLYLAVTRRRKIGSVLCPRPAAAAPRRSAGRPAGRPRLSTTSSQNSRADLLPDPSNVQLDASGR